MLTVRKLALKPLCVRPRKDGNSIIHIQYCHAKEKTLLDSGIVIPVHCWDKDRLIIKDNLPGGFPPAASLNAALAAQLQLVIDLLGFAERRNVTDTVQFIKAYHSPKLDIYAFSEIYNAKEQARKEANDHKNPKQNLDFFFQLDNYIESKRRKVTPGVIGVFRNLKEQLLSFEEYRGRKLTFEDIDFNLYDDLVNYLTHHYVLRGKMAGHNVVGLKTSTVGKTIKQLRVFLRDRIRRKIIEPIDLTDFKILDEESDAIYLSMAEITRIYELDLSNYPKLCDSRNLFVLGALTGLRFSDFTNIKHEDYRNGMLYKKQGKSDHWVVIPLRAIAKEVLHNHFKNGIPVIKNPAFNADIKEIGRLAGITESIKFSYKKGNQDITIIKPKYGWICSHTCRRSFCTNEFLAGTPVELIMKISGHKSVKDFYKYIRISPEEAGHKIRKIWQERGEMSVIS